MTATQSHLVSGTFLTPVALDSVDQTAFAATPSPTPYSSSLCHAEHLISWYVIDEKSDEDLLEAYFCQNPGLAHQLSYMKTNRRKRQTDVGLVRDYKFVLEVYKLLMERRWEVRLNLILNLSLFSTCRAE